MKILVLSDSHGNVSNMLQAVERWRFLMWVRDKALRRYQKTLLLW